MTLRLCECCWKFEPQGKPWRNTNHLVYMCILFPVSTPENQRWNSWAKPLQKWWDWKTVRLPTGTLCNFSGANCLVNLGVFFLRGNQPPIVGGVQNGFFVGAVLTQLKINHVTAKPMTCHQVKLSKNSLSNKLVKKIPFPKTSIAPENNKRQAPFLLCMLV